MLLFAGKQGEYQTLPYRKPIRKFVKSKDILLQSNSDADNNGKNKPRISFSDRTHESNNKNILKERSFLENIEQQKIAKQRREKTKQFIEDRGAKIQLGDNLGYSIFTKVCRDWKKETKTDKLKFSNISAANSLSKHLCESLRWTFDPLPRETIQNKSMVRIKLSSGCLALRI